jgi:hypothetical protein
MNPNEIISKYPLQVMLGLLPAEIIYKKKNWFRMDEVFELAIRKSKCFNTWTVEYYNDQSVNFYFQTQSTTLTNAIAEMLFYLAEEKFIDL